MKNKYRFILIFIVSMGVFIAALTGYIGNQEKNSRKDNNTSGITISVTGNDEIQIKDINYNKDGISAKYPLVVQGGTEEERKQWNKIIQEDFNKIIEIYSFNPFPETAPIPTGRIPILLEITYEIKMNDDKLISILYHAAYNSPYSAHPTELVYTTNIDKANSKRLKLSDIVELNEDFIKNFRTWDFIPIEKNNEELNQAVRDYVADMSDEDLYMGFQSADNIGSGNPWGIYSYLTEDKLGISLGVPNYIGDHVEFEREYSKLKEFLKVR